MTHRSALGMLVGMVLTSPVLVTAEPITFEVLAGPSRAVFKGEAPLETFVGTTAEGITGTVTVDPTRPQAATGTIRVDLRTVVTGITQRDSDMRGKDFLDTDTEANRYATFEIKSVDVAGALEPGRETPAKVRGVFSVRGKPVDTIADARVTYVKLTPEQVQSQKPFGVTAEHVRVKARFDTKFTSHGMRVPQFLFLKAKNDIQVETDLTLVRR